MIQTTQFIVKFYGDKSVGIFDSEWIINGDFQFEDNEAINAFKKKITEAFEYCSDTPIGVYTKEEFLKTDIF